MTNELTRAESELSVEKRPELKLRHLPVFLALGFTVAIVVALGGVFEAVAALLLAGAIAIIVAIGGPILFIAVWREARLKRRG